MKARQLVAAELGERRSQLSEEIIREMRENRDRQIAKVGGLKDEVDITRNK